MPAKPRGYRTHPQAARVYSTKVPAAIERRGGCFVPLEDFRVLERKYLLLFKRMQRAKGKIKC